MTPLQSLLFPATPDYQPLPDAWDEMWDPAAGVRPHWQALVRGLGGLAARDWAARVQRIQRLLRENGVTYHVYNDPRGYTRTWDLDPVPLVLDADEWRGVEAGLDQRARLLDRVLRDLYGPQTLLRRGLLPPELVLAHAGYLRPLLGALPAERRQLIFYAADLVRGPDGRIWVMADRTQAPSGAGYALENRAVMARTFPEWLDSTRVTRLNGWLGTVQASLNALAPSARDTPQVVVLSPGPANETYFEHAYLAARLGYTLAQGDDLTVKDGRVWLKTVTGLKPVHVILRRVDEAWCDPLELRQDSRLGSAGLVEAVRRGHVALANPLGSGLLENPALMPFLPSLARALLDEDLLLPTAATWWCGQARERDHVLANLSRLVLKPIQRGLASETVFGSDLDRRQLAAWRERILAQPHLYVGQEPISLSTVPALQGGRMAPHRASLRAFLVARPGDDGYATLPGGLARCASGPTLSSQRGALNKDTWIAPAPLPQIGPRPVPRQRESELLTSRAADNLFWTGRYLARAEAVAHLLRTVLDGLWEEETAPGLGPVLEALMRLMGHAPGACGCAGRPDLAACVRELATRDERPGNLAHTVGALLGCAYGTREYWSAGIWRLLDRVERDWGRRGPGRGRRLDASPERTDLWIGRLIDALAGLGGLASETLPRHSAFRFFDLGRRIEHGFSQATLLAQTLESRLTGEAERESLSLVLQSADSLIPFRRRYRTEPFLAGTLELLLWDGDSPSSLMYQLRAARHHLAELRVPEQRCPAERLLFRAEERLYGVEATVDDLVVDADERRQLIGVLGELAGDLAAASDAITLAWFTHVQSQQSLQAGGAEP